MVNDVVTKECFRADHLLEAKLEELLKDPMLKADRRRELEDLQARIDELNPEQMSVALKDTETKSPDTNNDLSEPYPFNLMFPTQIGPSGTVKGFLRPETAQGIFVNFRDLLYYNGGKLPPPPRKSDKVSVTRSLRAPVSCACASSRRLRLSTSCTPNTKNTRVLWKSRTPSSTSLAKTPSWAR